MALQLNQELFSKQNEIDEMKQRKLDNVDDIQRLQKENQVIDQQVPLKEREIHSLIARVKQEMTNRVNRINAACFRGDQFKYRARLDEDMSVVIEKETGQGVFATVWGLCQTESGEYGIDPEQNHLPGNPAEQLHLFSKFPLIIQNLK